MGFNTVSTRGDFVEGVFIEFLNFMNKDDFNFKLSVPFLFIIYFYLTRETAQRLENIFYLFNLNFYSTLFFYFSIAFERTFRFSVVERSAKNLENIKWPLELGFSCAF